MEANDNLKSMGELSDDIGEERLALYNSFKAVTGLGDPVHPKLVEKNVKGVLKHIFGSSPKYGTVQRRLLSSTVDMVGRAVITPDSDLDMDSVGLPETKAWDVYRNFVIRRLKRRGMSSMQAVQAVREQTPLARKELELEMQNRPVIVNRAPVLHRFGIMAFRPQLVKDDTLHISPLVVNGFGADFDGDAVQYHVPVSEDAVKEARERLLPSRNLLSPADFKSPVHSISKEFAGGLHHASTAKSRRRTKTFRRLADVIAAHNRGEISMDDEVEIMERRGKS
jgi:DNA-directed RNA polymerase subunit beta'